jgi:hypothetical protein
MFQILPSIALSRMLLSVWIPRKLETYLLFTHLRSISILHLTTYFHCSNAPSFIVHPRTDGVDLLTMEFEVYAGLTRLAC